MRKPAKLSKMGSIPSLASFRCIVLAYMSSEREDQARWNTLSNNRADVSDERASLSDEKAKDAGVKIANLEAGAELAANDAEKAVELARKIAARLAATQVEAFEKRFKILLVKVGIALAIVSIGISAGLFEFQSQATTRSQINACAINTFVEAEKVRGQHDPPLLKLFEDLQSHLVPPLTDCKEILK